MTIYIPMIILTVFLADIQERIRYRGRKISILLITLLPPTLVAAFRYNNGADYPMYFQLFTRLGNGSKIAGIIQFLYLKRKIKYHISNTALVLSLFSTMVMAAVVCAIIKMNLPLAVALAMEISIGGAIYLLMNIALKNRILSEMLTKVLKKHNTGFQDS